MENSRIVLDALAALEERRMNDLDALYHPQIAFHWQSGLPYGRDDVGADVAAISETFAAIWTPLQPDKQLRRLSPMIVATQGEHVVARHIWRGVDDNRNAFHTPTLAHCQVDAGQLRDARMCCYGLLGLTAFLERARA